MLEEETKGLLIIPEYEKKSSDYRKMKVFQGLVTALYTLCSFGLLADIYRHIHFQIYDFSVVVAGMYLADLFTGFVHIYLDTKSVEFHNISKLRFPQSKLNRIAYAFQFSHHIKPMKMIDALPMTATDGQFEILLYLATPIFISCKSLLFFCPSTFGRRFLIGSDIFILFAMSSQILHALAHSPKTKVPYWIRLLQNSGFILSNQEHLKHHKQNEYFFSIVNGWSNPLLNVIYDYCIKKR